MVSTFAPIKSVGKVLSFEANADLSANQFYPVKLVTGGKVDLCTAHTDRAIGVLLNDPIAGGEAEVGMFGVYPVKMGNTTAAGDRLCAKTTTGEADVTTSTADWVFGIALAIQASGDIGPVLVGPFGNL